MVVTLQTLSKYYYQVDNLKESFIISLAAENLPQQLQEKDTQYMQVNLFNMRKQSVDLKQKQDQRMNDIKDILQKILIKDKSLSRFTFKENQHLEYLPQPTNSVCSIQTSFIHGNFKECHDIYRQVLGHHFQGEEVQMFDELVGIYKSSVFAKILSFSD